MFRSVHSIYLHTKYSYFDTRTTNYSIIAPVVTGNEDNLEESNILSPRCSQEKEEVDTLSRKARKEKQHTDCPACIIYWSLWE